MSILGAMLAWSAVQASLVLVPAAVLHAFASRRSPASGAWVASVGLGLALVVGVLSLTLRRREAGPVTASATPQVRVVAASQAPLAERKGGRLEQATSAPVDDRRGLALERLRAVWERLDRTAAEPAARCRPWGKVLALVGLLGAGAGLLQLLTGLCAIHHVRRRGRPVDDAELLRLLAELQAAMECRRGIEIRETADVTSPATAGWRSAVILLPEDWRSWDADERRAVLAHELAHVARGDFLTGVMARAAIAVYFYHPIVLWLAARLRLEQELAADALGARFAGGRARYLHSLSRLALRQDGRLPCWPARAFLPAKGTLIRRIAMLREETRSQDQPWSAARRGFAVLLLLVVAAGASLLHGPALADEGDAPAVAVSKPVAGENKAAGTDPKRIEPFDISYVVDNDSQGFVAVRPSAVFGRSGMAIYRTALNLWIGQQWAMAAKALKFDPTKPGMTPPRVELFEQVTTSIRFWRTSGPAPNGRFGLGGVFTVRTTEPLDWVGIFRTFKLEPVEARDGDVVYYKLKNAAELGPDGAFYCPNDRTLVLGSRKPLLELIHRKAAPPTSVFAQQGKEWDQALRGLVLVAIDNRGGRFVNAVKEDERSKEDIDFSVMLNRTDLWAIGLEDADDIVFRSVGTCSDGAASEATAVAIRGIVDRVLREAGISVELDDVPDSAMGRKEFQMALDFLQNMRVEHQGRSIFVRSAGLGTIADLASLVAYQFIDRSFASGERQPVERPSGASHERGERQPGG